MRDPTPEEERAIAALQRLAKKWPQSLKLFSAAGSLVAIAADDDDIWDEGGRLHQDAPFAVIPIPNDGGDPW